MRTLSIRLILLAAVLMLASISSHIDTLAQTPHPIADATGLKPNRAFIGDLPFERIDTLTGNVILTFTDIVLPGYGTMDVAIQRSYNSKRRAWTLGFAGIPHRVINPAGVPAPPADLFPQPHSGDVPSLARFYPIFLTADGGEHTAYSQTQITWFAAPRRYITERQWKYNAETRMLELPNGLQCTYDTDGRLREVHDPFSNWLDVTWNSFDLGSAIQHLGDGFTRTVTFSPNQIDVDGRVWTYNESGSGSMRPPAGPGSMVEYSGGELSAYVLPGGGRVEYDYSTRTFSDPRSGVNFISKVVSARRVGGHEIAAGAWSFDYPSVLGDRTTVTGPYGIVQTFDYIESPSGASFVLHRTQTSDQQGADETQETTYLNLGLSTSPDGIREVPIKRTTTRNGRSYEVRLAYGPFSEDPYLRLKTIEETDESGNVARTKTLIHDDDFSRYIIDRVKSESVTMGGESLIRRWEFADGTGAVESETVNGVTTQFGTNNAIGAIDLATDAHGHITSFTHKAGVVKDTITPRYTIGRDIYPDGTIAWEQRRGFTTTFEYDAAGRQQWKKPPAGHWTETLYDPQGQWVKVQRSGGGRTEYTLTDLDGFGRAIRTTTAEGISTSVGFDALGRKVFEGRPFDTTRGNYGLAFSYDALDRLTKTRDTWDQSEVTYAYSNGVDVTITDQENHTTVQNWDAIGDPSDARLTSVTDAKGSTFGYTYHVSGQLASVQQPGYTERTWEYYPGTSLLQRETHPESGSTEYTYDGGRLATKRNARKFIFTYGYDANDRLTAITLGENDIHNVTFGYDDSDNRTLVANSTVSTALHFDAANRLDDRRDTWSGGPDLQTRYELDGWDRIRKITYPSETEVEYDYDLDGRVREVRRDGVWLAKAEAYHPSGAIRQLRYKNGILDTFAEDDRGRLTAINAQGGGPLQVGYQYDKVGNLKVTDDARSGFDQQFVYDSLDRLEDVTGFAANHYTYDELGNRKTLQSHDLTFNYQHGTNRLETVTGFAQHPAVGDYGHDAAGNMTSDPAGTYDYNPFNMLEIARIPQAGGGIREARYYYDGDSVRKVRAAPDGTFAYLHGPGNLLLAEYESTSTGPELRREYFYLGSRLVSSTQPGTLPAPPVSVRLVDPVSGDLIENDEPFTLTAIPTLTASGDSIARVIFYRDGVVIDEDTTAPYSITWTSHLPAGRYNLLARVVTTAGLSATSAPVSVQFFPVGRVTGMTITPQPPAAGQTAEIRILGNENECSGVQMYFGDGTEATWLHGFPLSTHPLVGYHAWTETGYKRVVARTIFGKFCKGEASAELVIPGPNATLTSPASGSTLVAPAALTLTADASDTTGGTIARVDFYANGALVGSDNTAPYAVSWSGVPMGGYSLVAKAVNTANVVGASPSVPIEVIPPPLVISVLPASPSATIPAQIEIGALAGCSTVTVTFGDSRSDTFLGVAGQPLVGTYAWPTAGLKTIKAQGQGASCPSKGERTITVQAAPVFALSVEPESPLVNTPATVKVTGPGSCNTVNVDFGEGPETFMGSGPPLTKPHTWTTTGTKTITAQGLGAACDYTATATVTVQPPAAPISVGVSPASPFAGTAAQVTISAPPACTAVLVNFGDGTTQTFNQGGGWPVTNPHTWAASGAKTISATGSTGTCPSPASASVTIQPPAPPPLTITVNPASPGVGMPAQVTINGPAPCTTVNVDFGDGTAQTFIGGNGPPITNSHTWTSAGTKTVTAQGLGDQCDLYKSQSISVLPPPTVSLTAPSTGATYTSPATVNLAATASAAQGTITQVQFYANGALLGADTSSPFTFTWAAAPTGTYSLVAKATDSTGLVGTSSAVNIVVGDPPPSTVLGLTITPNPIAAGQTATITVTGTNPCGMLWMDFGDGAWWIAPIGQLPFTTTHTWAAAGSYSVLARGFVDCGGEVTRTVTVGGAPEPDPLPSTDTSGIDLPAVESLLESDDSDRSLGEPSLDTGTALPEPPQSTVTLTVNLMGTGSGSVTSSPAGLLCTGTYGAACSAAFPAGTTVTLTMSAAAGSTFSGWGSACAGKEPTCTVTLTASHLVVASFAPPPSTEFRYYHLDAIGSVRAVTDAGAVVPDRFDYGPFGEGVEAESGKAPLRFAAKARDLETALDYFGARYYASRNGRFTTVDPVMNVEAALTDPQRWNRYSYAVNRPLVMIDPDGREAGYIYLPSGQMVAPIKGVTPTMGKLWLGTISAGAVAAAGPSAWRSALACFLSPSCQSSVVGALESVATQGPSTGTLARAFGFEDYVEAGAIVGGKLANGAVAAVSFATTRESLSVNVSMVARGAGGEVFGAIEKGAIQAAKAAGVYKVRIIATSPSERVINYLKRKGFEEIADGNWSKELAVR